MNRRKQLVEKHNRPADARQAHDIQMVQHKDETIKCVTCWEEMWLTQININTFQRDKCICKMPEDQWEKCAAARDKRHKEMLKTKGKPKPKYLMTKNERKKAEQQFHVVQKVDWGRASFTDNTVEIRRSKMQWQQ